MDSGTGHRGRCGHHDRRGHDGLHRVFRTSHDDQHAGEFHSRGLDIFSWNTHVAQKRGPPRWQSTVTSAFDRASHYLGSSSLRRSASAPLAPLQSIGLVQLGTGSFNKVTLHKVRSCHYSFRTCQFPAHYSWLVSFFMSQSGDTIVELADVGVHNAVSERMIAKTRRTLRIRTAPLESAGKAGRILCLTMKRACTRRPHREDLRRRYRQYPTTPDPFNGRPL